MYSEKDAIDRVLDAQASSLKPDEINFPYLIKLRAQVERWIDDINEQICSYQALICDRHKTKQKRN